MRASRHVAVRIDLDVLRKNAKSVRMRAGAPVIAVVKSEAYGLGAREVAGAIAEFVDGFCVFDLTEAADYKLFALTGRPLITIQDQGDAADCLALRARPAVWTVERASALRAADPVLSVDTGQQRFACPPEQIDAVLRAGGCREAMTHATTVEQVQRLVEITAGRGLRLHAAGSSLLDEPAARLDAVRPGMALYPGAARVSARLVDVRDTRGPGGYTGFTVARHGVILCGFSNYLRTGPCVINGRRSRVLEVGMQSAFVECAAGDRVGDEVTLLGEGLTETEVAQAWNVSPQSALAHLVRSGVREYQDA